MGLRNAFAALTRSAADDRLAAAWADAASPIVARPFGPGTGSDQGPPNAPPIDWTTEGMPPSPGTFGYSPSYTGHTYKAQTAPIGFEGWGLLRVRNAVALHRLGIFWESSLLMVSLLGFAPVLAALAQAVAPIADLDRYIRVGDKGPGGRAVGPLAKYLRGYLEETLVPRHGLLPSPYLEPVLWITMMIYMRMMGFCVLQHVDGEPDPDTQIRPRYTRIWPPWAVKYERTIGKWWAYTSEGIVEIKNDGKFTLVCDEQEPHFTGAIVAISEEVLSGRLIQQLRNSWFFKYGNPKWVAIMPEKVATGSTAGDLYFAAVQTITGPDGVGALPYGSDFKTVGLDSKASDSFGAGLQSVILHIAMVLVGGSGTGINGGEEQGEGYKPQKGGQWEVKDHLVRRPLKSIIRALNGYHIAPHLDINWRDQIAAAKKAGTWSDPTLDIPFPRPEAETRMAALAGRYKLALEIIASAHEDGILVDADFLGKLNERLELDPPLVLADISPESTHLDLAPTDLAKVVRVDEARASRGLPPIGDERGDLTIMELEALGKAPKEEPGGETEMPQADGPIEPAAGAPQAVARAPAPGVRMDAFATKASIHSVKFDTAKAHAVYIRDGYKCQYCGKHDSSSLGKGLSIDHIDARARGGAAQNTKGTPATNLVTACGPCNSAKQDRTPRQWNDYQKTSGQAPPPTDWSKLRGQAQKKIDIKAGEKNAAAAKKAREAAKSAPAGGAGPGQQHDPENGQFT